MEMYRNRGNCGFAPSHALVTPVRNYSRVRQIGRRGGNHRRRLRELRQPAVYLHNAMSKRRQLREIDITGGSRARCSAMSPLPRICIQAYADKQPPALCARCTHECINPWGGGGPN